MPNCDNQKLTRCPPTGSKTAVRALADTLRQEVLRYNTPTSSHKYTVHCGFFSNFSSDAFVQEQKYKPDLTKRLEGTSGNAEEMLAKMPSPAKVAKHLVSRVEAGDFAICDDLTTALLLSNMRGPTPKTGWGLLDSMLGCVASLAWPVVRWKWDRECVEDGKSAASRP
jgi:3-dehydrosphinganine reductase